MIFTQVGPLLTYWFNVMERILPGRAPARVAAKLVIDQVLQGPFMIGSMFALCAAVKGSAEINQCVRPAWRYLFTILAASTQRESAWRPRTRRLRLTHPNV